MMRRFELYRFNLPTEHQGGKEPKEKLRAEGCIFTDGTVAIRWMDGKKFQATSIWDSFEAFMEIHGHPEFDTEIKFLDKENEV